MFEQIKVSRDEFKFPAQLRGLLIGPSQSGRLIFDGCFSFNMVLFL